MLDAFSTRFYFCSLTVHLYRELRCSARLSNWIHEGSVWPPGLRSPGNNIVSHLTETIYIGPLRMCFRPLVLFLIHVVIWAVVEVIFALKFFLTIFRNPQGVLDAALWANHDYKNLLTQPVGNHILIEPPLPVLALHQSPERCIFILFQCSLLYQLSSHSGLQTNLSKYIFIRSDYLKILCCSSALNFVRYCHYYYYGY